MSLWKFWDVKVTQELYDATRKWFGIISPIVTPMTFFADAPFGRFTPSAGTALLVDGIKSWIVMESVSFIGFAYTFLHSPLSPTAVGTSPPLTLAHPPTLLAALYIVHYINRSFISPLRTPSRSKSHISVPLFAIAFHVVNGSLLGTYLSSPAAQRFLADAYDRPLFWAGVVLWTVGFVGNIVHDEVLLNIRRKAKAKGKSRAPADDDDKDNGKNKQEHYAVPHGYLYNYISYPNYFCEWLEWTGFALAAAPVPSFGSFAQLLATASPPWLFVFSEVCTMLPRAYRGHKWYHKRFPDYPRERKAVIPFLF